MMQVLGEKITHTQVKELYGNLKVSLVGLLGIVTIITAVLYGEYHRNCILVWAAGMFAINGYRYYTYRRFDEMNDLAGALYLYLVPMALSGTLFSSLVFFFFPEDPEYQVFLLILLTGIVSSGVVQNAQTKISVRIFLVATLLPLIIFFVGQNTYLYHVLAGTIIFYFVLITKISDHLYKEHTKTRTLQQKYHDLIRDYETERQRMEHFFNYAPVGVFFFTADLVVTNVNEFLAKKILGVTKEKLVGLELSSLRDARLLPALQETFKKGHGNYEGGYHTTLSDKELWIKLITSSVEIEKGCYEGVGVMVDLSELKETQAEVEHLAYYDELTDVPKRAVVLNEIKQAIAIYKREKICSALIYFDLDKFKDINDHLGHNVGDRFLQHVANQATLAIRQSDVIARMGGDEFAILLPMLAASKERATLKAMEIARRVREYVSKGFEAEGRSYHAALSMGIVLIDNDTQSVYDIVKAADTAMYKAKRTKRNGIVIFDRHLADEVERRYTLRDELVDALEKKQFLLYLQPKVTQEGEIFSAEALLRWQHPTKGLLTPEKFLPVIVEFNLMEELTRQVLEMAYSLSSSLPAAFTLSINISASDIQSSAFMSSVEKLAHSFGCRIDLELTEQMLVKNTRKCQDNMRHLHSKGIEFSLDDFGTGYSSLAYLKQLPLDYLKIDKSFVDDMLEDSNDLAIVRTIIAIAHSLGLKTVAEGVEQKQQFEVLQALGCDYFQGYFFNRPMPQEAFLELLKKS